MEKKLKIFITSFFTLIAFIFLASQAEASDGTFEIRSLTGEPYKCFAASVRMQNLEYRILFTCQNLIYPAGENIYNYIAWATPKEGGNSIKLGALGLGKGEFKTKTPFVSIFITTESNSKTKTPSGNVVMRGEVQPLIFMEEETTPTPTLTPEEKEEKGEEIQEEVTSQLSTKDKLILALKRAGIAALFALVALIGVIFVVSRSRG